MQIIKTILNRGLIVITTLLLFIALGAAVVSSDRAKKIANTSKYYDSLLADWTSYRNQYNAEVERIKNENSALMTTTKDEYERLLSEQPSLIEQHTRKVANTVTNTANSVSTLTSTSQTTKQTIKVTKPQSKPTTRSS